MGYTHYWSLKDSTLSQKNFNKVLKDIKRIEKYFEALNEPLYNGNGTKKGISYVGTEIKGEFECEGFYLNGDASKGADHETFSFGSGENEWNFCKTARKEYDIAVCMILLSLKYHVRSTNVSSDGDGEQNEWGQAFDLWKTIFKRNCEFKFKEWKENSKIFDGSLSCK